MKELPLDYDISVINIVDLTKEDEKNNFELTKSLFFNINSEKFEEKNILFDEFQGKQIFKMNDRKFILEIETEMGDADYFYSENLKDLI